MAELKSHSDIKFTVTLELNEDEARALHAITIYGFEPFTKVFYKSLGQHYLLPHDDGLANLFATLGNNLPKHLEKIDRVRSEFK